ncbi:universal stress protein [Streptomyces sp. NPDC058240]|uniref:universal stress protein n=1 Tax=Streptomyces sp. NPDC058240 TaxID=3346396 RepID=UPI0036E4C699
MTEDAGIALLHEARHAEALITGERGRGGLTGLLLGSVGLAAAARAPCPVTVVRGAGRTAFAFAPAGAGGRTFDGKAIAEANSHVRHRS